MEHERTVDYMEWVHGIDYRDEHGDDDNQWDCGYEYSVWGSGCGCDG